MNTLILFCGIMMLALTLFLMSIKIKTGMALESRGHFVSLAEDPLSFWIFTLLNFIFLLLISLTMIFVSFTS
jgi:hypothetical protein